MLSVSLVSAGGTLFILIFHDLIKLQMQGIHGEVTPTVNGTLIIRKSERSTSL